MALKMEYCGPEWNKGMVNEVGPSPSYYKGACGSYTIFFGEMFYLCALSSGANGGKICNGTDSLFCSKRIRRKKSRWWRRAEGLPNMRRRWRSRMREREKQGDLNSASFTFPLLYSLLLHFSHSTFPPPIHLLFSNPSRGTKNIILLVFIHILYKLH